MILSICIPSYNRFDELRNLLNSISEAKSSEFNVFVLDNGSYENIFSLQKYDNRFNFIKRDKKVPGPVNVGTSLNYGDAKYVMLCLDKDFIVGECLDKFINIIKNENISCGYCQLNSKLENGRIIKRSGPIDELIYRCGHPSGYFFKKEIIELATQKLVPYDTTRPLYNNPFIPDLIYAYGVITGNEGVYNGKLIIPETLKKASEIKSYTYNLEDKNIYFMPECRRKQMFLFIYHLNSLEIDKKSKKKIVATLFKRTLYDCTLGYKHIMINEQICSHHSLNCEKISTNQLINEGKILTREFKNELIKQYNVCFVDCTVFYSWIILGIKMILGK